MTEDVSALAPELLERADAILGPALALQNPKHPLVRLVHETGREILAAELAANAGQYSRAPSRQAVYEGGLPRKDIADVARKVTLPALPEVALRLQQVTGNPESSAQDVATVIALDPSLSTALLHLVNSAFYNFPSRIDTIDRAVAIVGSSQIHALAMGRMVLHMVGDLPPAHFDMDAFWEHSVACGMLARGLAELRGSDDAERAFLSGMLHDIGKLAIASSLPEYAKALAARDRRLVEFEAERDILGFEHGRFGAMVLRKLDIPYSIVEAVANHHHPMDAKHPESAAILHVANFMARCLVVSTARPPVVAPLWAEAWSLLELDPDDLRPLIADLGHQLEEMVGILAG